MRPVKTKEGSPCSVCTHTLRYIKGGNCVKCNRDRSEARKLVKGKEDRNKARAYRRTHWAKTLWQQAGSGARARGLAFEIEESDIHIPSHCPVFGTPLVIGDCKHDLPSLDRLDSARGYTPDNIWVISWRANHKKNALTVEEGIRVSVAAAKELERRTGEPHTQRLLALVVELLA